MTFNPLYHPRRPDGKFRDASLGEGWHGYMGRNGDCHFYYVHNREHLEEGFAVLQMAGSGRPMTLTDEDPNSRAHVIDSGEGEQMICSSSYHGAFGVTDHDSPAPPVPFSLSRASFRFQSDAGREADKRQGIEDNRHLPYNTIEPSKAHKYLKKGMARDDELDPLMAERKRAVSRPFPPPAGRRSLTRRRSSAASSSGSAVCPASSGAAASQR